MPIKPENKALYPANWSEIRARILKLAKNRCEFCGVKNHLIGWRDADGDFHEAGHETEGARGDSNYIKIVLTIAHLDHDPTNNDRENLRALCQRCHLNHDKAHHAEQRAKTRFAKELARGQGDALDEMMRRRRRQRNRQAMLEQGARVVRETEGQGSFLED